MPTKATSETAVAKNALPKIHKKKRDYSSLETYIRRMNKSKTGDCQELSQSAVVVLDDMIKVFGEKIVPLADQLRAKDQRQTLTANDLISAVRFLVRPQTAEIITAYVQLNVSGNVADKE